jgi:pimeloyl-ACP methyl ester carboxylesterase
MSNDLRYIQLGNTRFACSIHGEGEPLLLITGFAALMDYWGLPFINMLSSGFRVIVFDNRGMGGSERGTAPFSIEQFAKDSADILDALSIESAHVLGWSMGSFITQELALNYPDKVNKIVLYATSCGGAEAQMPSPEVTRRLFDTTGTPEEMTQRALDLMFPSSWLKENPVFAKGFTSSPMKVYVQHMETIREQVKAIISWGGTYSRLKDLKKETLLLTGTEDYIVPLSNSEMMRGLLPDASLEQIEGGGHGMIYQFPEKIAQVVMNFLGQ